MASKRAKTNGSVKSASPPISAEIAKSLAPSEKIIPEFPQNGDSFSPTIRKSDSDLDLRELLRVLSEVKNGNFSVRMSVDMVGFDGKICDTLNDIIMMNEILMSELTKAGNTIGKKGNLTHRIELPRHARGAWSSGVDAINGLISDLVHPTIEIAHVIGSVAKGNLSQEMPLQIGDHVLQGEFQRIAREVNDMVKQLNLFSMEVTRVPDRRHRA